ncbi:MAG: hypothetical protein B5M48_04735 [Candidatus Omnitrophica bacterium 4484_213]|nr:MAG: hypothetical protein B5M48_04735 [Candidatus Omnitrophica bacterium 4484_213]
MHKAKTKISALYILIDVVLIAFSTCLPYILRYNKLTFLDCLTLPLIWQKLNLPSFPLHSFVFLFWGIIAILILNNYNLYTTDREMSIPREIMLVFKSVLFSSIPTASAVFFFKIVIFSRLIFGQAAILMFITLSLWRAIKRLLVRYLISHGYNNFNALIIGAGKIGKVLADEISKSSYLGLRVVGFLDDHKQGCINGYKILGRISDLERIVRQKFVDEVLITIPGERKKIVEVINQSKPLNISVKVVPDQFDSSVNVLKNYHIGFVPLLEYSVKEIHGTELLAKRISDITLSALGLLFLSPLFALLAILIKLDSKGSVFYVSKRIGKKGKPFDFYKFRTMVVDAEKMLAQLRDKNETDGPIFKMKNDPRITRIGRFLRRYSLDELPQLWNVLKGNMSIVGPRPPIPQEVKNYKEGQLKRLEIKPGITGLWQIRGRSDASFHRLIRWDIWYIRNWSLWLDLKIILKTIPAVLKGKGAY